MHPLPPAFVAAGLLGLASAQSPDAPVSSILPPATTVAVADQGVVTDTAADGTLWAAGPTWKASFAPAGTTFVPCFGPTAPRNFPASLQRAAVTVAGEALANEAVAPQFAPQAVEFRGATFTERYALRDEGIEQQFVFPTLPKRGALQVLVPLATELAYRGSADGGFRFANEHGSFGYGRAVAIDADGDRLDLATEWVGSGFRITVPAEFVATAALPLVIDPLLGSILMVASDTRALESTDLAFDASLGRHAVVWERVFSATDSDVYCRYLDATMAPVGTSFAIDLTTDSWRRPQVAGLEAHDRFLVVAQKSTGNAAPFGGIGRLVVGLSATQSTPFAVLTGGGNVHHLDVGGDVSAAAPAQFLVVGEVEFSPTDHDIHAQAVAYGGAPGPVRLVDSAATMASRPQVSKHCGFAGGGTEAWGITYRNHVSAGAWQAMFASVDRSLATIVPGFPVGAVVTAANFDVGVSSPTDHGDGRLFGVAYHFPSPTWAMERWFGTVSRSAVDDVPIRIGTNSWRQRGQPQVETDGLRFLVAGAQENPSNTNARSIAVSMVGRHTYGPLVQETTNLLSTHSEPAVLVRRTAAGSGGEASLAWIYGYLGVTNEVQASTFAVYQSGPQLAYRLTGCGSFGFLAAGSSVLGDSVSMQTVAAAGLVGWVAGLPADLPVGPCPGCRQGVNGSVLLGSAMQFDVPRDAAFVGVTVAFQAFQFVPAGQTGACLGQVNLTNTLDVTIR